MHDVRVNDARVENARAGATRGDARRSEELHLPARTVGLRQRRQYLDIVLPETDGTLSSSPSRIL